MTEQDLAEATRRAQDAADRAEQAEHTAEQATVAAEKAEAGAEGAEQAAEKAEAGAEGARDDAERARVATEQAALAAAEAMLSVDPDDPLLDTAVRKLEAQVTEDSPFGLPGPPMSRRSPFRIGFTAALGVGLAYLVVQSLRAMSSVLLLLLVSGFLAVGLNPAVEFFTRRGLRRGRAVAVVLVVVLLLFAGFALAIVPPIVDQAGALVDQAPDYIKQLQSNKQVASLDKEFGLLEHAKAYLQDTNLATSAFGGVLGVGKIVFSAVFTAITVLTLTLYFMSSLPQMKESAYRLVPRSRRARVGLIADDILERVGGYVAGCLTIAGIAGISSFVILLVLGVPYPVALALVVAVTDLIPIIGATVGAVVVTLVAFTVSTPVGIGVGLYYLVYQQFENFLLYPRVMKRSVDVSPAVTVVAILAGAALLGIVGALLAIPIAAAVQLVLEEVVVPRQDVA